MQATAADVLEFWFQGDPTLWRVDPWFRKSDSFDAAIRELFGTTLATAQARGLASWCATAPGTLALLIVLDQFGRNLHRNDPLAFASDARAREIARIALAGGIEQQLTSVQRVFVYLPFEHAETLENQNLSVQLFAALPPSDWRDSVVDYAERHRAVIREFGRFPHRNAAVGRVSTQAEQAWLDAGGGF